MSLVDLFDSGCPELLLGRLLTAHTCILAGAKSRHRFFISVLLLARETRVLLLFDCGELVTLADKAGASILVLIS